MAKRGKSPAAVSPARDAERKRSMVNIWVGKQVGPELEEMAIKEEATTGHTTTKLSLAREIFLWGLEIYRRTGTLARLKATRAVVVSPRYSKELQEDAYSLLQELFEKAPSPIVEQVTRMLNKHSGTYGGEK